MSDERAKKWNKGQNDETEQDDVEAHKKLHSATDEPETTDDDVEAHVKIHKDA